MGTIFSLHSDREKGSAMLLAMMVAGGAMALVSLSLRNSERAGEISRNIILQKGRDEIGKMILSQLSNPEVIKKAARPEFFGKGYGNQLLSDCLKTTEIENCKGSQVPLSEALQDGLGYYTDYQRLILPPLDNYQYPPDKIDAEPDAMQKNCPRPGHVSCLIAGGIPGSDKKVGYNFDGESGTLSPCFPLEAVVYMNPVCGKDPLGQIIKSCKRARQIELAYQIIDRSSDYEACPNPGRRITSMGFFPRKPEFISIPAHALVPYECNPGAIALGTRSTDADKDGVADDDGEIECVCRFPYSPTGKQNEKGVICEEPQESCPAGTLFIKRRDDGRPVCKHTHELSKEDPQALSFGTKRSADDEISCQNKGWLQDFNISCVADAETEELEGEFSACLYFYSIIKFAIGTFGMAMIPEQVPDVFYPGGSIPCYAVEEKFAMGNPFGNWLDGICTGIITGGIILGGSSKKKKEVAKEAVAKEGAEQAEKVSRRAALKSASKNAAKKVAMSATIRTGVVQAITGGLPPELFAIAMGQGVTSDISAMIYKKLYAIPFVGPAVAIAFAIAVGVSLGAMKVDVPTRCYPLLPPGLDCDLSGVCYHFGEGFRE